MSFALRSLTSRSGFMSVTIPYAPDSFSPPKIGHMLVRSASCHSEKKRRGHRPRLQTSSIPAESSVYMGQPKLGGVAAPRKKSREASLAGRRRHERSECEPDRAKQGR